MIIPELKSIEEVKTWLYKLYNSPLEPNSTKFLIEILIYQAELLELYKKRLDKI